jgi:hypothetical protein
MWRIGLFHVGLDHVPASLESLESELRVLGHDQGRDIQFDWRNLPDEAAARVTAPEAPSGSSPRTGGYRGRPLPSAPAGEPLPLGGSTVVLTGRATHVPQVAVTGGTQRTTTVTPGGPLRWARAADLDREHGATLHGMQGSRA